MLIGAHARTQGSLLAGLERARAIGADAVQIFVRSPRMWRASRHSVEELARYRECQSEDPQVVATYCHASYLVNLATPDPVLLERSRAALVSDLTAARGIGASGLVVHVGSHLGRGFDAVADQVVEGLLWAIDTAVDPVAGAGDVSGAVPACPVLIENTAGAGGSIGSSFEELSVLLERAGAGDALGVCLDTQHLWASGVPFDSPVEADDVVAALDATVGLGALGCLHLNDSKAPFGTRVDRHANLGEGAVGEKALGCLIGHPAFGGVAAILEVPGAGHGPRAEDVAAARRALRAGQRLWRGRAGTDATGASREVRHPRGAAAEWEGRAEKEER